MPGEIKNATIDRTLVNGLSEHIDDKINGVVGNIDSMDELVDRVEVMMDRMIVPTKSENDAGAGELFIDNEGGVLKLKIKMGNDIRVVS